MVSFLLVKSFTTCGILDSRIETLEVSFSSSTERTVLPAFSLAISSPILESSFCRDVSASLIAFASFCRRSRSFWGLWRRSFWGDLEGLVVGRVVEGVRVWLWGEPRRVGMLEVRETVLECPLPDQRSFTTTPSVGDMMFWGRSVRLPAFLDVLRGVFSF